MLYVHDAPLNNRQQLKYLVSNVRSFTVILLPETQFTDALLCMQMFILHAPSSLSSLHTVYSSFRNTS